MPEPAKVFPAHAGMSPGGFKGGRGVGGFPRTRGDEPVFDDFELLDTLFSPHTRG